VAANDKWGPLPRAPKLGPFSRLFQFDFVPLQVPIQQATLLADLTTISGSPMGSRKVSREAVLGDTIRLSPYQSDIEHVIYGVL